MTLLHHVYAGEMTNYENPKVLVSGSTPIYSYPGDAGADLRSAVDLVIDPGERALVPTGTSIALPQGFGAFVMPRSGLALTAGVGLVNSPGVIDAGYRGEISVVLINHDPRDSFRIEVGDRIAQLVVMPVARATFCAVDHLPQSGRAEKGFGSTG